MRSESSLKFQFLFTFVFSVSAISTFHISYKEALVKGRGEFIGFFTIFCGHDKNTTYDKVLVFTKYKVKEIARVKETQIPIKHQNLMQSPALHGTTNEFQGVQMLSL